MMRVQVLFDVLITRYSYEGDDFPLSIGHWRKPYPEREVALDNMPEFGASVRVDMGEIRQMAKELEARTEHPPTVNPIPEERETK